MPIRLTDSGVLFDGDSRDRYFDETQKIPFDPPEVREDKIKDDCVQVLSESGNNDEATYNYLLAIKAYERERKMEAHLSQKYAVFTRMASPTHPGHVITTIAANHGRAAEGVAEYLADPAKIRSFMEIKHVSPEDLLKEFQAVFEVYRVEAQRRGRPGDPSHANRLSLTFGDPAHSKAFAGKTDAQGKIRSRLKCGPRIAPRLTRHFQIT